MNKIFEEHTIRLEVNIKEIVFRVPTSTKINFSVNLGNSAIMQTPKYYRSSARATEWKITNAYHSKSIPAS